MNVRRSKKVTETAAFHKALNNTSSGMKIKRSRKVLFFGEVELMLAVCFNSIFSITSLFSFRRTIFTKEACKTITSSCSMEAASSCLIAPQYPSVALFYIQFSRLQEFPHKAMIVSVDNDS